MAGLVGALVTGWVSRQLGIGPTMVLAELLIGTGTVIIVLAGGSPVVTFATVTGGLAIVGVGDSFYNINVSSLRQALTPDALLGRVSASLRFVIWGAQPFGALLGGVLGQRIGPQPALGIAAAGYFCAFIWLLISPLCAVRTQPTPAQVRPHV